jgi:hypothetical protein
MPKKSQKTEVRPRFLALDYLRGFFIVVIIIDHLWRFPSLWSIFTGEARLWVTAAEGFIIISGFLIGYVRGYKGLRLPFKQVARKLAARSGLLYLWVLIGSVVYAAIDWYVTIVPNVPSPTVQLSSWLEYIIRILTLQEAAVWVYFLLLYAVFIMASIGFVWLLRKNLWWVAVAISIALYIVGFMHSVPMLKWQIVFFMPALVGFYFNLIYAWWQSRTDRARTKITYASVGSTIILLFISFVSTYLNWLPFDLSRTLNQAFSNDLMSPARVLFAYIVFVGYARVFTLLLPLLTTKKFAILHYFGTHSLTAYIAHGVILCVINTLLSFVAIPNNIINNTLIGIVTVLMVYWFIRIPLVARIIPR